MSRQETTEVFPSQEDESQKFDGLSIALRTARKTAYLVFTISVLVIAMIVSLFPYYAGGVYFRMGMNERAFQMYEIDYLRSQSSFTSAKKLDRLNELCELAISIYSKAEKSNNKKTQKYYAKKIIKYGGDFLLVDGSDVFSAERNADLIARSAPQFHVDLADHRGYIVQNIVRSLVFLDAPIAEIDYYVDMYFFSYFIDRVINDTATSFPDDVIMKYLPNWIAGAMLEGAFVNIGLKVPAIIGKNEYEVSATDFRILEFERFYVTSTNSYYYTDIYTRVRSAATSVDKVLTQNGFLPESAPIRDKATLLQGLLFARFLKNVATDMYLFNCVMISDGRGEYAMSEANKNFIQVEIDFWKAVMFKSTDVENRVSERYMQAFAEE